MNQSGKLMPNLDEQGTKILNLTVLQRIDPCILHILFTAAHVSFYQFNIDLNQWSRKDVEGSLFVVKRNAEPWYQFIVMNRRNTENLVENLLGDFEYEIQIPYLLYKNAAQEVNGIWFYNTRECEEVANLINRIIDSYPKIPLKPQVSNQSDFKELEPTPSMVVMDGPLEPSPISSNAVDANENTSSLTNFFNTAANLGNNGSYSGRPVQNYHPSNAQSTSLGMSNLTAAPAGAVQVPATSIPSVPRTHNQNVSDPSNRNNQIANLVKPSSFYMPHASSPAISIPPVTSSMPPITPQPSMTLQRPYGAPLLQPFPPPNPSPSLTPHNAAAPSYGPVIDREKIREALMTLVQDNQFIDMICRALQQGHQV
ncbi:hypothetical protein RND81_01G015400 [Saponaria officinalis]|uniref:mRNA-decapping enzyme-like protein n=1 Tax=Saponaria officinalis TaxID=3572 RepID=A0AAW1NBW9_SAPOF